MNKETAATLSLANKVVLWAIRDATHPIGTYGIRPCDALDAKAFLLGVSAPQVYYYAKRNGLAVKKLAHSELCERRKKAAVARWSKEKAGGTSGGKKKNRPEV
ncbi:MAG: hypothetical protein II814_10155 [Treponema sp.]|nr:hypothetical protein [Treponema sp.]